MRRTEADLLEALPTPTAWVGPDLRVRWANAPLRRLLPAHDFTEVTVAAFFPGDLAEEIELAVRDAVDLGLAGCISSALRGSRDLPLEIDVVPLHPAGCLVQARDLSELFRAEQRLGETAAEIERLQRELREREPSTAPPTVRWLDRARFQGQLGCALDRLEHEGMLAAVLLLDIHGLGDIGRSLGPDGAAEVLAEVASRLGSALRDADVVARHGADELAILLDGLERPEDVGAIADRLAESIERPLDVAGRSLRLGVSFGAALYLGDGTDPERLMLDAEAALAEAKTCGQGSLRIHERPSRQGPSRRGRQSPSSQGPSEQLERAGAVRRAAREQEFSLHYQPQFDIGSLEVVGAEALLRWTCPEQGPIGPGEFVPILEATGLIAPVGAWALGAGCREAASWAHPARVSVNLSARQFRRGTLLGTVRRCLAATGLDPERLELELTESLLMTDVDESARTLRELKQLGVRIAVDDFGTGYSSLSYLKRFPVDAVKIDRSFIQDLERDRSDQAICRAIIRLGHELGLVVIGEGIETRAQLEVLGDYGCDVIQGFLLGRPAPTADLRGWKEGRVFGDLERPLDAPPRSAA